MSDIPIEQPRRGRVSGPAKLPGSGDLLQKIRLASGLILMVFVVTHYLNHALGVFSFEMLELFQDVRRAVWRSWVGSALLYGALLTHAALALWKTIRRRTLRMPIWEAVQLVLGLAIPWYLIHHILATRGINQVYGLNDTYTHELSILWPTEIFSQSFLLSVVWLHGVIGLHYWLRMRRWYRRAFPVLVALAVALPLAATWGWIDAARRLWLVGLDEGTFTKEQFDNLTLWIDWAEWILIAILVGLVAAIGVRLLLSLRGSRVTVTYPGDRRIRAAAGPTLLEISRMNGIPHASVCGGRARCSTCRTAIVDGFDDLPPPSEAESAVLKRIDADENVRLACQVRPAASMTVRPMMPVRETVAAPDSIGDAYHWGVEQPVAVLFSDIRGFTSISEHRLSYDVVFILNRYLDAMTEAIENAGGYVDKYIGDGIMAIFGMTDGARIGCRQALEAAAAMGRALDALNADLAGHLDEPLRIGIGIHAGQAILGRIGAAGAGEDSSRAGITALGDTVNTASRLESATKDYGVVLIVSRQVAHAGGLAVDENSLVEMQVRGRRSALRVCPIPDFETLGRALAQSDTPVSASALARS